MRITKEKYQENHDRIVAIASQMFRERGFDGVGLVELMERAGLTHGGFYNHFDSKEDLIAEAIARGFAETAARYAGHDPLAVVDLYVSREHRDGRGDGCPAAALSCEAARQPDQAKLAFAEGIETLLRGFAIESTGNGAAVADGRALVLSVLAQAVGAVVLSRACPDASSLADEILDTCRAACRDTLLNRQHRP